MKDIIYDSRFTESYDLIQCISRSENSPVEVYKARHRKNGMLCLVKRINKQRLQYKSKTVQNLQKSEIEVLEEIDHPNLTKVIQILEGENYIYLVFEHNSDDTIKQAIQKAGGFTEREC